MISFDYDELWSSCVEVCRLDSKEPVDQGPFAACWKNFSNLLPAVTGEPVFALILLFYNWCHSK